MVLVILVILGLVITTKIGFLVLKEFDYEENCIDSIDYIDC